MDEMTSIYLSGVLVEEPVTAFTDLIAGGVGIFAAVVLYRLSPKDKANQWLSAYFIFIGIGLFCAGLIGHAFFYLLERNWDWKALGWSGSALAIFCMERGSILSIRPYLKSPWITALLSFFKS